MPVSFDDMAGRPSSETFPDFHENLMYTLNQPTAAHPNHSHVAFPASLFPAGTVFTVIGQIHDWHLRWAGRIECGLHLSIGDLVIRANRDTLPPEIGDGSWVRVKLMHRNDDDSAMHVLSAVATVPAPGATSWVPTAGYHRVAGIRDLRRLLSTLEPGLQGLFMSLTLDHPLQRQFFWRLAAADHHCYPGGLFDQSIGAAAIASSAEYANPHDRGLVTLASLLWDIGKASDSRLSEDSSRGWPELQPHVATLSYLKRPLELLARSHPELAREFAALVSGAESFIAPITNRTAALRRLVHSAVHESRGPLLRTTEDATSIEANPAEPRGTGTACRKQPFSLAWAGGFVDGEGCISIVRQTYTCGRKETMRLVCSITQNNRKVLEHLRDGAGIDGRIYKVKHRSFHTKPVFVLNFDGKKAMAFIALLTPYLIRKRAEALTAWAYWVEGRVGARFGRNGMPPELRAIRERLYLKMRSLK